MPDTVFPIDEFARLVQPLVGLTVTLPWKGYGSAIFLELGQLTVVESRRRNHAVGEACISVEWDWRVEHKSSVLYGSSNTGPRIEGGLAGLQGATIESLSIAGKVPELIVLFSNGHSLRSMAMVTGDPEWSIKLPQGRWVFARSGELPGVAPVPGTTVAGMFTVGTNGARPGQPWNSPPDAPPP